jgi:hypothetical protein
VKRTHPGRPRVDDDDTSIEVGVTLPGKQYDAYSRRALHLTRTEGRDVTVPEIIRRELQKKCCRLE